MDRWTDNPASGGPEVQRSRFRRSLDGIRNGLSGKGDAAAILLRGGIAIGLVALVAVGAMIQGRSGQERLPQVKGPSFTTVPVVRQEPGPRPPSEPLPEAANPFLSPTATMPAVPGFLPRVRFGPASFCEDLADFGFPGARWAPSQVFANEWECAAPLRVAGAEQNDAFMVARGRRGDAVGSLMLRLNPASPAEKADLIALAERVGGAFAAETGLILPEAASKLLTGWTAGEVAGVGGRMRLVTDRAKPESRVLNLAADLRLARPAGYICDDGCVAEMRALAAAAPKRAVKSVAP